MTQPMERIAANLRVVREQMADAARRSGRPVDSVRLVAVTKYVTAELARCLFEAGCADLGENRPQELCDKARQLADLPIRWHLIGHLQRNKLARTLPHVHLLHSLDSMRLGQAIEHWAVARPVPFPVLLEVNISGEDTKTGIAPADVPAVIQAAVAWRHVAVHGLMGMARLSGGPEQARRDFVALRQLRDNLTHQLPAGPPLSELSMGMSGDYCVAIEEGATLVRVGSALFEGVAG